jgi:DinB superfamily
MTEKLTSEARKQKLESYGNAHSVLVEAANAIPREAWNYRPTEGWTIHEILVHISDSEANSYVRARRLLAEPGTAVLGYDEAGWAKALDYSKRSPDDAMDLFKWLRKTTYDLIKDQADAVADNTINHSENGPMTFDDWLDVYDSHIPEHVGQMQRAYEEWKASR